MDKKILLLAFFFVLLVQVSAVPENQGTYKKASQITLVQNCIGSTYSNVTRIMYPNGSIAIDGIFPMTKNGDNYNYTFINTSASGIYNVYGHCDTNGTKANWLYTFTITPTGATFDTGKSIMYVSILSVSFLFLILLLWAGFGLPSRETKDAMTGYIIAIDNVKYVKMLCIAFAYLMLMLLSYFGYIISYAYLDLDFLANLFNVVFNILVICTTPLFIVGVYIVIANAVRDHQVGEMLSRGLRVR